MRNSFLGGVYERSLRDGLRREALVLAHINTDRPRRAFHFEPPTPEQQSAFEKWKAAYEMLEREGWDNGWLETPYGEDTQPTDSPPRQLVYDESEEEFEARLKAWEAAQPPAADRYVTFPVVRRGSSKEPGSDD